MEIAAYVCSHVFENKRPVLLVSRADGDWQFLCGKEHGKRKLPKVVGINHLFDRDPTLLAIADLPYNWEAERKSIGSPWQRKKLSI
jgi:hypothetical protein